MSRSFESWEYHYFDYLSELYEKVMKIVQKRYPYIKKTSSTFRIFNKAIYDMSTGKVDDTTITNTDKYFKFIEKLDKE